MISKVWVGPGRVYQPSAARAPWFVRSIERRPGAMPRGLTQREGRWAVSRSEQHTIVATGAAAAAHRGGLALLAATGVVLAGPQVAAAQPSTTRANLDSTGAQATAVSSSPSISADGRFVAFLSSAPNLVAGDTNGSQDIFLRDRLSGETRRVSVGPGGAQLESGTDGPRISANGRIVLFRGVSSDIVPGSTGSQLYFYDRTSRTVRRVAAAPAPYHSSANPSISDDGGRVAFTATSGTTTDVFVADTTTGAVMRVSETASGTPADGASSEVDISGDGRQVAFATFSKNLATPDINGLRDIVVRDLDSGAFTRVSVGAGNAEGNGHASTPALSRDGCIVAFLSTATNLVALDAGVAPKVFARDRCAGDTEIASISNGGTQAAAGPPIDISGDGCLVAFRATTAVNPAPSFGSAAVLRDRCAGATSRLDLATTGEPGGGGVTDLRLSAGSGRYAVFSSSASNLVDNDSNGVADTFVRDRAVNAAPLATLTLHPDGHRVTADATASSDPDGYELTASISFGDGSPAQAGLQATHEYVRAGTFSVTVTVTDADRVSATSTQAVTVTDPARPTPQPPPPDPDPVPPAPRDLPALVLDGVRLSPARFAVLPRGAAAGGARGGRLRLRLSAAATVTLRFERALPGRRVGNRCAARARRGPRCTRFSAAGTLGRRLPAGRSAIALTGRVGSRTLAAGRYRLRVSARGEDGAVAKPRTLTLTILRSKKRSR
jgi:Tol biopolymer transport system component